MVSEGDVRLSFKEVVYVWGFRCANCSKEAQFYCCWNTSYCDYPCQQKHWLKHMSKCTQTAGQNQPATTPVRPSGQQLVLTPTAAPKFGVKKQKRKNNKQELTSNLQALFAKPQKVYLKRTNTPFKVSGGAGVASTRSAHVRVFFSGSKRPAAT
jgi:hypothetical protein